MDYDGGGDARGSLLGHSDGRLEIVWSRIGEDRRVFCAIVIGCNTSRASKRHVSSLLPQQFHLVR